MIRKVIIISMVVVSIWTVSSSAMNTAGIEKQYTTFLTNQQYKGLSNWLASMPEDQRQKFFGSIINNQSTPLNMAVEDAFVFGDTRLVETLLRSGASADAVSAQGITPFLALMSIASAEGTMSDAQQVAFKNIVNLLLRYSRNPQALTQANQLVFGKQASPLEYAIRGKFPRDIIWFLLDHNMHIVGKSSDGDDIMQLAEDWGYPLETIYQDWLEDRVDRHLKTIETIESAQDLGFPKELGEIIGNYASGTQ